MPRVLVVDDDPRIGRLLTLVSRGGAAITRTIEDAATLAAALDELDPDIVFLDLQMARCDGVEALRELAARGAHATIVVMSGVDPRVVDAALALGRSLGLRMAEPLRKPFTTAAVRERLAQPVDAESGGGQPLVAVTAGDIATAITDDAIEPYFQPIVDATSGAVVRIEALARWRHSEHGVLAPAAFLGAVERNGLMPGLTLHMLDRALAVARTLERAGHTLDVAVNLSPVVLGDVDFPDVVHAILAAHQWSPERLVFELTEHRELGAVERVMDVLARIRLKGIGLSLDDFGSGYSSVGRIYRLPLCELKIDKGFVLGGIDDLRAAAIVRSTLELARADGLRTVAEGVASEESREWLTALGCDLLQGFHFAPPLAATELEAWLADNRGRCW